MSILKNVELGKIYTVEVKGVSVSGREIIHKRLLQEYDPKWVWVDWNHIEESEAKAGKAMAAHLYKTFGLSMTNELKSEIGSLISRHTDEFTYHFEIIALGSRNFWWWEEGDYGDDGSCYWGEREFARELLVEHEAYAVRIYHEDSHEHGAGRCWLFPIDKNHLVIWNGYMDIYGLSRDTLHFANMLSVFLNTQYNRIDLTNNRESGGILYINNGIGFIVGPHADKYTSYDLEWPVEDTVCCVSCDCSVPQSQGIVINGEWVCHECRNEHYSRCNSCRVWVNDEFTTEVEGHGTYCDTCTHNHTTRCASCEDFYRSEELHSHTNSDGEVMSLCDLCHANVMEEIDADEAIPA